MTIKNPTVDQLAKQSAVETGETVKSSSEAAPEELLQRRCRESDVAERIRRIDEVLARMGPTPPGVTSDHSDLYDEDGLPA
jgi:antitoxin VapB